VGLADVERNRLVPQVLDDRQILGHDRELVVDGVLCLRIGRTVVAQHRGVHTGRRLRHRLQGGEDDIDHACYRQFETQDDGERRTVRVGHVSWLHQRVFARLHQRVFVVVDRVRILDDETPAVVATLHFVVADVFVLPGTERSRMDEREVPEVEEVVDELTRCGVDDDGWKPDRAQRGVVPLGDVRQVTHGFVDGHPDETVTLLYAIAREMSRGWHSGTHAEGRYVGTSTVRIESPSVVRTLETTVDNSPVAQPGVAVRATVGEGAESRGVAYDDDALAQKFHTLRGVKCEFVGTTDGKPTTPQARRGVGERIR
jgi:hypothetical protein